MDFATGLERCRGAKDRFKRLLGFYLGDLEGWLVMIEGYRKGEPPDLKNATISFHAMKSASATVGATGLSGEAAKLEKAGREEDAAYLEGNALRCGQILEAVRWRIENFINDGAE
ncbi:MAG: Hpt domain-containing protein [Deltaproteobacteria bacterium]|nr:Hpt domain-containing protein [Deltaproteobacteria bacterium]